MLNIHARAAISRSLVPLGARLARAGFTPDVITVIGTIGAVSSAVIFFPRGWFFGGTLLVWGFVMLDMVDGAVARATGGGSLFGAVLDSTCDRVADAAVFGSLAWYFALHGQKWMLLGSLLCLVLGTVTSYIRARAEAAGLHATVGFAERAERLIIILVGTGLSDFPGYHVPFVLPIAVWALVALSALTVIQRLVVVYRQSRERQTGEVPA